MARAASLIATRGAAYPLKTWYQLIDFHSTLAPVALPRAHAFRASGSNRFDRPRQKTPGVSSGRRYSQTFETLNNSAVLFALNSARSVPRSFMSSSYVTDVRSQGHSRAWHVNRYTP